MLSEIIAGRRSSAKRAAKNRLKKNKKKLRFKSVGMASQSLKMKVSICTGASVLMYPVKNAVTS